MRSFVFRLAPQHATVEEHLDWCEANGVSMPVLHEGPDGRIRGGGVCLIGARPPIVELVREAVDVNPAAPFL